MKMRIKILFISLVVLITSCEKVMFKPDLGSGDPLTNFDYLWNEVDKKFSYFELKKINWDQLKNKYRPLLTSKSSEEELFKVLANMLNELRDDHTNLYSPFNFSRYNIKLKGPENYSERTVKKYYIPEAWTTGAFVHSFLANNEIGYIRYSSFLSDFSDKEMDLILNRYANTKGLILDLRANGGGSLFNIPKILGRFVQSKTLVLYSITRNGPKHSDFSSRENFYITPYSGIKYTKPLLVLIDRGSYSATTFFALATKAFWLTYNK